MIVSELWRYPVKSLGGERVDGCRVTELGLDGDRRWGLRSNDTGLILTAKRDGRLLMASATSLPDGGVAVRLPDGRETDDSADIAAWLDLDVSLVPAGADGGTFENPRDFERETDWARWQGPPNTFHDMHSGRVSIVSTATIGAWSAPRFRSNVLLDGGGEDGLVGRVVEVGSSRLSIQAQIVRCVMVTRAQPGLERDLDVLRNINRERNARVGVAALVESGGVISVGDAVVPISP